MVEGFLSALDWDLKATIASGDKNAFGTCCFIKETYLVLTVSQQAQLTPLTFFSVLHSVAWNGAIACTGWG